MSDSSYDSEVLEADFIIALLRGELETLRQQNNLFRGELETLRQQNSLLRQIVHTYQDGFDAIVNVLEAVSTATFRLPHPRGQPVATAMPAMPASGSLLGPPAAAGPPPDAVSGFLVEPSPEPAYGSDVEVNLPPAHDGPPPAEDLPLADPPAGPPVGPGGVPLVVSIFRRDPAPPAGPPPHGHGPLRKCQRPGCDRFENRQGRRWGFPGWCCHFCHKGQGPWHGTWCQGFFNNCGGERLAASHIFM